MKIRSLPFVVLGVVLLVTAVGCGGNATTQGDRPVASPTGRVPDFRTTPDPADRPLTDAESQYVADVRRANAAPAPAGALKALSKLPVLTQSELRSLAKTFGTFERLSAEWRGRPTPSKRLRTLRRLWMASLLQRSEGGRHLVRWIESGDQAELGLAAKLLGKGTRTADAMEGELDRLESLGSQ